MGLVVQKDKDEVRTFSFDWSEEVETLGSPTDLLDTVTYELPGGIVKDADYIGGNSSFITLSGGTAGQMYRVIATATLASGAVFQDSLTVHVVDLAVGSPQPQSVAFVVETGAALSNSNTYISVDDADAYHALRGNDAWFLATLPAKESALIKAAFYLVAKYRTRWRGIRVKREQALDWPRAGVITEDFFDPQTDPRPALFPNLAYEVPEDEIPKEIKDAQCEIALRIIGGTDPLPDISSGGDIKKLVAGPVSVEYFGAGQGTAEASIEFPMVDGMLQVYLRTGKELKRG
jgi:hypothetical protein